MKHKNGVYQMPINEYHESNAISRSNLIHLLKSPYHYRHYKENKKEKKPTEAMVFGNLFHTLCLENDKFYERYAIAPQVNKRTKEGKYIYSDFLKKSENKTILTADQYNEAVCMTKSLHKNEKASSLISGMQIEQSIFWTDEQTGFQCKARPDAWNGAGVVVDLKTAKDASYRGFQRACVYDGYFLQAAVLHQALESLGIEMETFVFVVVEKTEPYAVGIYVLDQESLIYGINLFHNLMEKVASCELNKQWDSYGVKTLSVPSWVDIPMENEQ